MIHLYIRLLRTIFDSLSRSMLFNQGIVRSIELNFLSKITATPALRTQLAEGPSFIHQEILKDLGKSAKFMTASCFLGLFILILSVTVLRIHPVAAFGVFGVFFIFSIIVNLYKNRGFVSKTLHLFMPGTTDRTVEIYHYLIAHFDFEVPLPPVRERNPEIMTLRQLREHRNRMNVYDFETLIRRPRVNPSARPLPAVRINSVLEKAKKDFENLALFVENNFQKSQSLTRFIGERLKDQNGNVSPYHLLFLLSIPKRKSLSIDAIKDIIQSALQHESTVDLYEQQGLNEVLTNPDLVATQFSNYSEEQLKKILTNKYTPQEYCKWLNTVLIEDKETDSELKFINQILNNTKRNLANEKVLSLDGKNVNGFTFKVLKTKFDYESTRNDFKNCIFTYFAKKQYDIFTVYKDSKPMACVSVDGTLRITEMKAPFNNPVTHEVQRLIRQSIEEIQ